MSFRERTMSGGGGGGSLGSLSDAAATGSSSLGGSPAAYAARGSRSLGISRSSGFEGSAGAGREQEQRQQQPAMGFGSRGQDRAVGLPAKTLRDEIRGIVREEIAPLDRRLLALERVSDSNAVTVQKLREQLTQTLTSRSSELEARFGSKLADATAAAQSQLAGTVEQLEVQLADHLDRLNAMDWAIQRQDVAFARSIDQIAVQTNDGMHARGSLSINSPTVAPPASPAVSRQGSGLSLQFTHSNGDAGAQTERSIGRTASSALHETRAAQAENLFEQSMTTAIPQSDMLAGSSHGRLKAYLFDDEPGSTPLMGLIARDAADIERRLSSMEQKAETERNVTLAALMDLESKLTREALDREHTVQVAARAVLATHRAAANANAGATFAELSRERGGALSAEDLSVAFHRLGVAVGSAEADFVVKALDVDGSGSIDGSELEYLGSTAQDIINLAAHVEEEVQAGMTELVGRMQTEIRGSSLGVRALQRLMTAKGNPQTVFQNLDTNGDGSLSRHELAVGFAQLGIQLSEAELTETIRILDDNGDGRVDLEEFVRMGRTATQLAEERELRQASEMKQQARTEELSTSVAQQFELSDSAAKQFEDHRKRLDRLLAEIADTQKQLVASHATERQKLQTLPTWLRLMSRPEAAAVVQKMDQSGTGLIDRDNFVTLLSEGLGEEDVEDEIVAGMIDLLGGLVNPQRGEADGGTAAGLDDDTLRDDSDGFKGANSDEASETSAESRDEAVQISMLSEICSLSRRLLENIEFTKDMDTQMRLELDDLIEKDKQQRVELDQMLHGKFGSQEERERAAQAQNQAAQAAVEAAMANKIAMERTAREAEATRLREEADQRETERKEAERLAAEEEAARLAAEAEAARQAAEEAATAQKEREAQEEALWQKKHGVLLSGWVSVELDRKNTFVEMWCVLTPGLISISEKRLMPAKVTYPLVGCAVEPVLGQRKAVAGAFKVSIDVEAQKRVQGLQLSDDIKRKFVMGFGSHQTEERQTEWREKITAQVATFAKDEDIADREKRLRAQPLRQLVDGLGLKGSIVKHGWLYAEGPKKAQDSRLCVISTALLTVFDTCPIDDAEQARPGDGDKPDEVPYLAQIPLARCIVTAETERRGMEGGSFRVKFSTEALAYATGERIPEMVLSCREPPKRKKGTPSEDWQEKMNAQAFLPPSWVGNVDEVGYNVTDALVTYEVNVMTGNYSGSGTKAQVFMELEGDASGQVRRSGKLVLNPQKQELRRGRAFPFSFECTDLGELQKVKIGHDNAGYSPQWQCEEIAIRHVSSDREWKVEVHAWFDGKKGDKQIEREFVIEQQLDTNQAGQPTPEPEPEPGQVVAGGAEAPKTVEDMPPGLTKMQQAAWKKTHGV